MPQLRLRSSQNATAAAAATLSESTLCDIGMRTTCVAFSIVPAGSPSPSVPIIIASLGMVVRAGWSMGIELSVSAIAAVVKPRLCSCSMSWSSQPQGTRTGNDQYGYQSQHAMCKSFFGC